MKIAWLSPLPPMSTGIGNYSDVLLEGLRDKFDITIYYVEEPLDRIRSNFKCFPISKFPDDRLKYDRLVYQLGNSYDNHSEIYKMSWMFPGILVLHDYNIHEHLFLPFYLNKDERTWYLNSLQNSYSMGRGVYNFINRKGFYRAIPYIVQLPMCEAIVSRNRRTIVHSEWMADKLSGVGNMTCIPHFARINHSYSEESVSAYKNKYGLTAKYIITCLGYVNSNKLPRTQVEVFHRLRSAGYDIQWVFSGKDHCNLDKQDGIVVTGELTDREFCMAVHASDLIVNLRCPTIGETSGTLMQSMSAGKAVILGNLPQYRSIPDEAVVRMKADGSKGDANLLFDRVRTLLDNPRRMEWKGVNAKKYAETLSVGSIVGQYVDLLESDNCETLEFKPYQPDFDYRHRRDIHISRI